MNQWCIDWQSRFLSKHKVDLAQSEARSDRLDLTINCSNNHCLSLRFQRFPIQYIKSEEDFEDNTQELIWVFHVCHRGLKAYELKDEDIALATKKYGYYYSAQCFGSPYTKTYNLCLHQYLDFGKQTLFFVAEKRNRLLQGFIIDYDDFVKNPLIGIEKQKTVKLNGLK